jgi:hypothetical protein
VKYSPTQVRRFAEFLNTNARIRNLPVDLLEKDLWITYILRELQSLDELKYLAFKGGSCLVKVYLGYYRFSEDIDLTWFGSQIDRRVFRKRVLGSIMGALGLEWDKRDGLSTGIAGTHSGGVFSYFLLSPPRNSTTVKLKITVAFDEKLDFRPVLSKVNHVPIDNNIKRDATTTFGETATGYFDVTDVWCYTLKEIACEKIRALLTRQMQPARSRDLVDLYKISLSEGLEKTAPPKITRSKLESALRIRAYRREYTKATQNLAKHLEQLVTESASDPVFFERPKLDDLTAFAGELREYIERHVIFKTQEQQQRN